MGAVDFGYETQQVHQPLASWHVSAATIVGTGWRAARIEAIAEMMVFTITPP